MKPAAATEAASLLQYDDSGLCYSDDVTHKEHVRNIGQLMSGTATALSTGGMAHTEPELSKRSTTHCPSLRHAVWLDSWPSAQSLGAWARQQVLPAVLIKLRECGKRETSWRGSAPCVSSMTECSDPYASELPALQCIETVQSFLHGPLTMCVIGLRH